MNKQHHCEDCKSKDVYVYCKTCDSFFCVKCDIENHPSTFLQNKHQRYKVVSGIDPQNENKKIHLVCEIHQKPIEFYCSHDDKLICSGCVLDHCKDHVNKLSLLSKEIFDPKSYTKPKVKVNFGETMRKVNRTIKSYQSCQKENETFYKEFQDKIKTQQEECSKILRNEVAKNIKKLEEQQKTDFGPIELHLEHLKKQRGLIEQYGKLHQEMKIARERDDCLTVIQLSQELKKIEMALKVKQTIPNIVLPKLFQEQRIESIINKLQQVKLEKSYRYNTEMSFEMHPKNCQLGSNIQFKCKCHFLNGVKLHRSPPDQIIAKYYIGKLQPIDKKRISTRKKKMYKMMKRGSEKRKPSLIQPKPSLWIFNPKGQSQIFSRFKLIHQISNYYEFSGTFFPKMDGLYRIYTISIADRYFTYSNKNALSFHVTVNPNIIMKHNQKSNNNENLGEKIKEDNNDDQEEAYTDVEIDLDIEDSEEEDWDEEASGEEWAN
ncbi:e3 ubiquitin-protein ligase trim56 [Anaeramoeba flamelloides]|uniref:E3 ubiquitin-protein ligase trim56 n=1 Tax=Anaeramoeba flamelloides TaxID=1746091 RepID=A0AAV7ZXX6_9EUKA|nr:e3 ubiquitin-protein ligase trim56 [Anaeramoeba flamelloides]